MDRVHDRELIDRLEALGFESFAGTVWRVARTGREPLRGSTASGRWGAPGEFEVVYTACDADGALAEVGYRMSLEPIWPTGLRHENHNLTVDLMQVVNLSDFAILEELGVSEARFESHDYSVCQAISAAARFLGAQAILVPNARFPGANLVLYPDAPDVLNNVSQLGATSVDWNAWRSRNRSRPSRSGRPN